MNFARSKAIPMAPLSITDRIHRQYPNQEGETPMVSRNLKRRSAAGRTAALVLAGVLFLGSGVTVARAQWEDPEFHRGLAGTWRLQLTVRDCQTGEAQRTFPAMAAFAKGGTLTVTTAGQPPSANTAGLGMWRQTDHHSYSAVSEAFVFSPAGAWIQTQKLTRTIEIVRDGDTFTDTVTVEILDTSGKVIVKGCGTTVGSRFQ
jgi:hypothetical protein